jgi:hypothetical protein
MIRFYHLIAALAVRPVSLWQSPSRNPLSVRTSVEGVEGAVVA